MIPLGICQSVGCLIAVDVDGPPPSFTVCHADVETPTLDADPPCIPTSRGGQELHPDAGTRAGRAVEVPLRSRH